MSYYQYMVSVYRSCLPQLNRSLRSSSVTRTSPVREVHTSASTMMPSRFLRANTVGPCDSKYDYVSAMPFTYSANLAHERLIDTRNRLSSVERYVAPAPARTYRNAYTSSATTSSSSYDYKVMDYANRLDREEATREYMDATRRESRYDNYLNSLRTQRAASPFRERYDYYAPEKYQRDYHIDTSDVGYSWKHYRLSNQTLTARNARAKSPIQSRELDRYYKTERRTSFIGDVSSGSNRDFRYYSYRPVPYFGGSDHYQYVDRMLKCIRKTVDYPMWYDIK